jgi:hypothetical protein
MGYALNPKEVDNYSAHAIRRNMAGRLDNPKILPKIIELLDNLTEDNETESFAEFDRICREDAHMETQVVVIDDLDLFIRRLWAATKAARQQQSIQPCW